MLCRQSNWWYVLIILYAVAANFTLSFCYYFVYNCGYCFLQMAKTQKNKATAHHLGLLKVNMLVRLLNGIQGINREKSYIWPVFLLLLVSVLALGGGWFLKMLLHFFSVKLVNIFISSAVVLVWLYILVRSDSCFRDCVWKCHCLGFYNISNISPRSCICKHRLQSTFCSCHWFYLSSYIRGFLLICVVICFYPSPYVFKV